MSVLQTYMMLWKCSLFVLVYRTFMSKKATQSPKELFILFSPESPVIWKSANLLWSHLKNEIWRTPVTNLAFINAVASTLCRSYIPIYGEFFTCSCSARILEKILHLLCELKPTTHRLCILSSPTTSAFCSSATPYLEGDLLPQHRRGIILLGFLCRMVNDVQKCSVYHFNRSTDVFFHNTSSLRTLLTTSNSQLSFLIPPQQIPIPSFLLVLVCLSDLKGEDRIFQHLCHFQTSLRKAGDLRLLRWRPYDRPAAAGKAILPPSHDTFQGLTVHCSSSGPAAVHT